MDKVKPLPRQKLRTAAGAGGDCATAAVVVVVALIAGTGTDRPVAGSVDGVVDGPVDGAVDGRVDGAVGMRHFVEEFQDCFHYFC